MPTKKVPKKSIKKVTKKLVKKPVTNKVAKKVIKKGSAKKAAKKSSAKKTLVYADNQKSFWVANGQILNSLVALRDALEEMEKEVYSYHAGSAQNDFAAWVDVVLSDTACAKDLHKAKTPKSAKTAIVRHLKAYTI
jgi:hypothetical protein